jgi:hypothetical protein
MLSRIAKGTTRDTTEALIVVLWSTSLAAKLTDIGNNLSAMLYSAV